MIHPSGARVDFTFYTHFQPTAGAPAYPLGLGEKTISGPGLGSATWRYGFGPSVDEAKAACLAGACPTRLYADEAAPDSTITRRVFGINPGDSQSLQIQQYDGDLSAIVTPPLTAQTSPFIARPDANYGSAAVFSLASGSTTPFVTQSTRTGELNWTGAYTPVTSQLPRFLRLTDTFYVPEAGAPFPYQVGVNPLSSSFLANQTWSSERVIPSNKTVTLQQNVSFTREVLSFDTLARPLTVRHASSLGSTRDDTTAYYDNTALWVIGQVASVTDVATTKVVNQTTYDSNALPTSTQSFGVLQQTLAYDLATVGAKGTLASVTDGRSKTTALSGWKRGLPQTITYPTLKLDGVTHISTGAAITDGGEIASTTDELNNTTSYSYDPMGRLSGITYPTGDIVAWNATTRTFVPVATAEYGIPASHWKQTVQTGNGKTTTFYDARWQPVLTLTEDTANAATSTFVVHRYDTTGHRIFTSYPVGSLSDVNATLDGVTTVYDALGRVIQTRQASELSPTPLLTNTEYLVGFQTRTTNPRGKQTTTSYQVFDQPSTDAPVTISLPAGVTTTIARQPTLGKPLSVTRSGTYSGSPVSATRSYVYDDNERLCKTINPESRATVVTYDPAGNIDWSADGTAYTSTLQTSCNADRDDVAAGAKTTRTYDALNRVTAVTTPGNAADTTSTYDYAGKITALTAANPTGLVTTNYTYGTKRGLLTGETSATSGKPTFSLVYGFDANANLSQLTYPDGHVVAYSPDALGRATQVTGSGALTYASGITYYPGGAIAGFSYGNGVVHTMTQNTRKLPAHSQDTYGAFKVIDDTYVFDANGNVDYVTDIAGTGNQNRTKDLGYDDLDRLIVADAPNQWVTATYAYDPIDNLRIADQGTRQYRYNYNATTNLLTDIKTPGGTTVFGFTYDARGNTTAKGAQAYAFDVANRMTAVTGVQSYRYDGQGRRVLTKDADSTVTSWIYSQAGQVVYTDQGRTNKLLNYIYLGNTQVAVRSVDKATSAVSVAYQHTDSLGSPVAETPSAAPTTLNTVRHSYAPYGEAYGEPTGGSVDGTGYTGHVMDRATNLTYMQQRYFDPGVGRFLSVDPVTALSDPILMFNRYKYAANNPYRFTDPDGRCESIGTCQMMRDDIDLAAGRMTPDEHRERMNARGGGALIGVGFLLAARSPAMVLGTIKFFNSASRLDRLLDRIPEWSRTKGPTKIGEREGGLQQANKDFDKLKLDGVKEIKNKEGEVIGRTGTANDGRQVTVREESTDGRATLEIRRKSGRGEEIRYNEQQ